MSTCLDCVHAGKHAFCNLGGDSRRFFEANSVRMEYPRRSAVFREGDHGDAVFILCSGKVKISATSREGRTLILRIAGAGDVLGMSAALANANYEVTAEALLPCRVLVLHVRHLMHMLEQYNDASVGVAKALAKDYRSAFNEARLIALPTTPSGRLARLILDWAAETKQSGPTFLLTMPLTHEELGSMTALTRETVTRTLGRLRKAKIIATRGVGLTVLQPDVLEQLSAC